MPKQATTADIRKGLAVLYETPRTQITRGIFIGAKRQGRSKLEKRKPLGCGADRLDHSLFRQE
jgi:hypothetical protein